MKLGYKSGYQVPKCPECNKYMHDPIESRSNYDWTFPHCGHYWYVAYSKDKKVKSVRNNYEQPDV